MRKPEPIACVLCGDIQNSALCYWCRFYYGHAANSWFSTLDEALEYLIATRKDRFSPIAQWRNLKICKVLDIFKEHKEPGGTDE